MKKLAGKNSRILQGLVFKVMEALGSGGLPHNSFFNSTRTNISRHVRVSPCRSTTQTTAANVSDASFVKHETTRSTSDNRAHMAGLSSERANATLPRQGTARSIHGS